MEVLVDKNANLNVQDFNGRTPLNISLTMGMIYAKNKVIYQLRYQWFFLPGQKYSTQYLVVHGAEVSPSLQKWEQLALGCALRCKFTRMNISLTILNGIMFCYYLQPT